MKFGIPTDLIIAQEKSIRESIVRSKKLGFDFVEIFLEPPFDGVWNPKEIEEILESENIPALGHFTWYADLSSWYEDVRKAWIKVCKKGWNSLKKQE